MTNLYSPQILRWSTRIAHTQPIDPPFAEIRRRSRVCGSSMTLLGRVTDGTIEALSWDLHLCAVGQAAVGILSQHVLGMTRSEFQDLDQRFRSMIQTGVASFPDKFEDFSLLQPVADYPPRHGSALLAFDCLTQLFHLDPGAGSELSEDQAGD